MNQLRQDSAAEFCTPGVHKGFLAAFHQSPNLRLVQHQPELPAVCVADANLLHPQFHLDGQPVFHAITFHRILVESCHIGALICSLVFMLRMCYNINAKNDSGSTVMHCGAGLFSQQF